MVRTSLGLQRWNMGKLSSPLRKDCMPLHSTQNWSTSALQRLCEKQVHNYVTVNNGKHSWDHDKSTSLWATAPQSLSEQAEEPTKDKLSRIVLSALPRGRK